MSYPARAEGLGKYDLHCVLDKICFPSYIFYLFSQLNRRKVYESKAIFCWFQMPHFIFRASKKFTSQKNWQSPNYLKSKYVVEFMKRRNIC